MISLCFSVCIQTLNDIKSNACRRVLRFYLFCLAFVESIRSDAKKCKSLWLWMNVPLHLVVRHGQGKNTQTNKYTYPDFSSFKSFLLWFLGPLYIFYRFWTEITNAANAIQRPMEYQNTDISEMNQTYRIASYKQTLEMQQKMVIQNKHVKRTEYNNKIKRKDEDSLIWRTVNERWRIRYM